MPGPLPPDDPAYHGLVRLQAFAAAANSPNRSYMPAPAAAESDIGLPDNSDEMLRRTRFIDDTCKTEKQIDI